MLKIIEFAHEINMDRPVIFVSEISKLFTAKTNSSRNILANKIKTRIGNATIDAEKLMWFKFDYSNLSIEEFKQAFANVNVSSELSHDKREYNFNHKTALGDAKISVCIDTPSPMKYKITIELPNRDIVIDESSSFSNNDNCSDTSDKERVLIASVIDKLDERPELLSDEDKTKLNQTFSVDLDCGFFSIRGLANFNNEGNILVAKKYANKVITEEVKIQMMLYMKIYNKDFCIYQTTFNGKVCTQEIKYDDEFTKNIIYKTGQFLVDLL